MIARLPLLPTLSRRHPRRLLVLISALVATVTLHGQGTLLPPSDPAPTMKTLEQVEARTIVNATNTPGDATRSFIITAPGSYYLTGNITGVSGKHGISIQTTDVTLDLNGFALIGASDVKSGIEVDAESINFCLRNGAIRGWDVGVDAMGIGALVEKLRLSANRIGLTLGNGGMVRDCVATGNGIGFSVSDRTQVTNCIATQNAGFGFLGTSFVNFLDCTANRNGNGGFSVMHSCSLLRCTAARNTGYGIGASGNCTIASCTTNENEDGTRAGSGSAIASCTSSGNLSSGFFLGPESTIRDCIARANGSVGITARIGMCHVVGNTCTTNAYGIEVAFGDRNRVEGNVCNSNTAIGFKIGGSRNLVTRNSAGGNGTDYQFESATTAVAIDLRAGVSDANTPPWANFIQ